MGIYTPNQGNCPVFRAHKGWRNPCRLIAITPSNVGNTEPPEFNEDTFKVPKRQQRVISKQKALNASKRHQNPTPCPRFWTAGFRDAIVGPKDLGTPAHFE